MAGLKWVKVASSQGGEWLVESRDEFDAMFALGNAELTCDETARPAFREMIDTLDWRAMSVRPDATSRRPLRGHP